MFPVMSTAPCSKANDKKMRSSWSGPLIGQGGGLRSIWMAFAKSSSIQSGGNFHLENLGLEKTSKYSSMMPGHVTSTISPLKRFIRIWAGTEPSLSAPEIKTLVSSTMFRLAT